MPHATRLFTTTRWIVKIAAILFSALAVVLLLAVGLLVLAALGFLVLPIPSEMTQGLSVQEVLVAATVVVFACALVTGLAAVMLVLVGRIVGSAIAGDPFVIKNANRLNVIGVLLLAIQVVGLFAGSVVTAFPRPISHELDFGFDLSLSGLFAALLVFVLAQIFRHGSEMRAELEGTV